MANTIKIKNSGTTSAAPSSLEYGELGLNYADGKIFYKNGSGTIVEFSSGGSVNLDALTDELENVELEVDHDNIRDHLGDDYVIIKVSNMNDKEKLLDYVKTEIYPYHADQEANIL